MNEQRWVHVVDDEESVRRSIEFLLSAEGYSVRRWPDGNAFLKAVDPSVPACALLDIRMPGLDGLETQAAMNSAGFAMPVIVLTGHGDVGHAVQAMKAGATDFLEKPFDRAQLLQAIATAFAHLASREMRDLREQRAKAEIDRLTAREREVLEGLACGYPNKTIAYDLEISTRTVEVYRANVMTKLGVHSFADALRIAFAAGMGSEPQWRQAHGLKPRTVR